MKQLEDGIEGKSGAESFLPPEVTIITLIIAGVAFVFALVVFFKVLKQQHENKNLEQEIKTLREKLK